MGVHQAFDVLADQVRRDILAVLAEHGECSAGEIVERIARVGRTTVSSHLRVLRSSGVVIERRDGRHRYYTLDANGPAREALEFLQKLLQDSLAELKTRAESDNRAPTKSEPQEKRGRKAG
jgi:DNA-binding transcriptional ArsR family regulator